MSPILAAYKNGQCLIQGPFFRFHDCYHLCKIEARQAAWELWSGKLRVFGSGVRGWLNSSLGLCDEICSRLSWTPVVSSCFPQPCYLQLEVIKFFPCRKTIETFLFLKLFLKKKFFFWFVKENSNSKMCENAQLMRKYVGFWFSGNPTAFELYLKCDYIDYLYVRDCWI